MPGDEPRHLELARRFGLGEEDIASWEASGLAEAAFDGWLTDRVARRPAGSRARKVYGADDVHDFARRAVLEALRLGAGDRLLEVGCGGGLLLRDAARTGASCVGLDHSPEMVALARERAPGAEVLAGSAEELPFPDGSFTAVAMAVMFFFLAEPLVALRETCRVLAPGGRLAIYTISASLRGTPAAPEPLASQSHFYTDGELEAVVREAGLVDVIVTDDEGAQLVTARRGEEPG